MSEQEINEQKENVLAPDYDVTELRKRIGMVFQKLNPFPKSIYENIIFGPRNHGLKNKSQLYLIFERSLRKAALWDEVKDRLHRILFLELFPTSLGLDPILSHS